MALPPDAGDRSRAGRAAEQGQAPRLLDRPQEAVVVRDPAEANMRPNCGPDRERHDVPAAAGAGHTLVEGDEDHRAWKPQQRSDGAAEPGVTHPDGAVVHRVAEVWHDEREARQALGRDVIP